MAAAKKVRLSASERKQRAEEFWQKMRARCLRAAYGRDVSLEPMPARTPAEIESIVNEAKEILAGGDEPTESPPLPRRTLRRVGKR